MPAHVLLQTCIGQQCLLNTAGRRDLSHFAWWFSCDGFFRNYWAAKKVNSAAARVVYLVRFRYNHARIPSHKGRQYFEVIAKIDTCWCRLFDRQSNDCSWQEVVSRSIKRERDLPSQGIGRKRDGLPSQYGNHQGTVLPMVVLDKQATSQKDFVHEVSAGPVTIRITCFGTAHRVYQWSILCILDREGSKHKTQSLSTD